MRAAYQPRPGKAMRRAQSSLLFFSSCSLAKKKTPRSARGANFYWLSPAK